VDKHLQRANKIVQEKNFGGTCQKEGSIEVREDSKHRSK